MENNNFVEGMELVYSTNKEYQISIMVALLEENGIKGNVINKLDSSYKTFGDIELYVESKNFEKAKEIVDSAKL